MNDELWPALPYEAWRPTKDTLQMKAQAIGKLRLALSPFEPGWANVPLYVTARGLNTSPLRHSSGERTATYQCPPLLRLLQRHC